MSKNTIRAKLDVIFKILFSENLDLLSNLLSSLLGLPQNSIENIVVKNSEIMPDGIEGKFVRMDMNMEVDGKLINVEMQYGNDPSFNDRTVYHWSKLFSGELKRGNDYSKLKPAICINIIAYSYFKCSEYHSHFTIMEKSRHEELTDKCAIHFFELTKIGKKANKDDIAELWLQLINAETEEELDMLKETNVAPIQKAVYILHKMSEDEKIQEVARLREKALHDEVSALGNAKREGILEGILEGERKGILKGKREGRREGVLSTATNAIILGMSDDDIVKLTGLTPSEVKDLRHGN
ncbi:MAG: Rpn family recombination-promoting nuclease/putative transposase [Oscillospiraceae bacterium]|nr:Rpn family recombination-promoting nuclease/putative transposase [Oscillospiraceae bacterium]